MVKEPEPKRGRSSKKTRHSRSSSSSPSPSSSSESRSPEHGRRKRSTHRRMDSSGGGRLHQKKTSSRRSHKTSQDDRRRRKIHRRRRRIDDESSSHFSASSSDPEVSEPQEIIRSILRRFPDAAGELHQLLQMIDDGQGVDISGISNKTLVKVLKKLFSSLKVKQNEVGVYLLPPNGLATLDVVGSILCPDNRPAEEKHLNSGSLERQDLPPSPDIKSKEKTPTAHFPEECGVQENSVPAKRRLIGPEMPSRELLAAAAELTEAADLLRNADSEIDNDLLIGPPPPAVVAEAESANEAEQFEEVVRITEADEGSPYDVLGVNWKTSSDNIKKRYWKLSLMVHPDKCSHPLAHQAFVTLNKAFKALQDPDKRGALDEKIKAKEEQEKFEIELRQLREAAQWRKLQGISMEGDEELLAVPKEAPKRDEWMTALPPERKPGMTMQSTQFSRTGKEGRGDTSVWTDSPLDKAQKAKQNYLEAYNKAQALAYADDERKIKNLDAALVDRYNSSKRSMSLVEKHQEKSRKESRKLKQQPEKEWEGNHPWRPWDREKDLAAGRQKADLDSKNMAQGLSSRFASGSMQRNFL